MQQNRFCVTVNGEDREVAAGLSVARLLGELGIRPGAVVVEINLDIVPREQFSGHLLSAGDTVEIVHFVGGG